MWTYSLNKNIFMFCLKSISTSLAVASAKSVHKQRNEAYRADEPNHFISLSWELRNIFLFIYLNAMPLLYDLTPCEPMFLPPWKPEKAASVKEKYPLFNHLMKATASCHGGNSVGYLKGIIETDRPGSTEHLNSRFLHPGNYLFYMQRIQ